MQPHDTTNEWPYGYGYCCCGCGQKTSIAKQSRTDRGWINGEPTRYIAQHGHRINDTAQKAFWNHVAIGTPGECWIWQGHKLSTGYGSTRFQGKRYNTHRLSWILHYGPIPDDLWVLHKCDNPSCVNPAHLFLGTPKDNTQDMVNKGRRGSGGFYKGHPFAQGEAHHSATVNEAIVHDIRERFAQGQRVNAIAKEIGVSYATVWFIAHRKSWRHIP